MDILVADYIFTPDGYIQNKAILFDNKILEINDVEILSESYPQAHIEFLEPNSVIYPGFINTHVHLEFSSNTTSLKYGNFTDWLETVIKHRDGIMKDCNNEVMQKACDDMMKSGITSFGAISSNGLDMETCLKTPQRVVYFNEAIGGNPLMVDIFYNDLMSRINKSIASREDNFIPAIAIHSPYSVSRSLIQKVVKFAKDNSLNISAHLLESKDEREWLENSSGAMADFMYNSFGATEPANHIDDFIDLFDGVNVHFAHCVYATQEELDTIYKSGHSIAHCPRSNRLLGSGRLPIEKINSPMSIATDGLSSNWSLNIFDELRAALMMHNQGDLTLVSNKLLNSITSDAAKILNLNSGVLSIGKNADFTIISLPSQPIDIDEISYLAILHTINASQVYINGNRVI